MRRRSSIFPSASDGRRVRKKVAHFKQPPVSTPSTTAQERLMVVAMGRTDDGYEAWTHRDAAHAYGEASRSYTALTLASDHTFWSYSTPQGARKTSRCVGPRGLV